MSGTCWIQCRVHVGYILSFRIYRLCRGHNVVFHHEICIESRWEPVWYEVAWITNKQAIMHISGPNAKNINMGDDVYIRESRCKGSALMQTGMAFLSNPPSHGDRWQRGVHHPSPWRVSLLSSSNGVVVWSGCLQSNAMWCSVQSRLHPLDGLQVQNSLAFLILIGNKARNLKAKRELITGYGKRGPCR